MKSTLPTFPRGLFRNVSLSCLSLSLSLACTASVLITEDFDYGELDGTNNISIDGLNGGSGWSGAWSAGFAGDPGEFYSLENLTVSTSNYTNTGAPVDNDEFNLGGDIGGSFSQQDGGADGAPDNAGIRSFSAQTGTTWISVLMQSGGDEFNRVTRLYINPPAAPSFDNNTGNYFGLQGAGTESAPEPHNAVANISGNNTNAASAAKDTPHLFVAKLETDVSASNDRLSLWFDPTIASQTESGLGTADFVSADTADIWGSSITNIALHVRQQRGAGFIDSLRISGVDGDGGVQEVLSGAPIPEPGSFALALGLASLTGIALRRRRSK